MAYDAGFSREFWTPAADPAAGYVTLGTQDLKRAQRFYDEIAHEIGARRSGESHDTVVWGLPGFGLAVSASAPLRAIGRTPLQADDPEQVRRLFEIALSNGGVAEEAPQDHGGGLYAAYFRDPDGNRINAFCVTEH